MKRPKAFRFSFQYEPPIPRHALHRHNRRMANLTPEEIERAEEIDDLLALIKNLNLQLTWAKQHNQQLRTKLNRYEATLGIAEAA